MSQSNTVNILYKYVTSPRALTCIPEVGDGTLRATQPASLNDPFECAVMPLYIIRDREDENRQLAKVLTDINDSKPVAEEDVERARQEYGSLFTRQLLTSQLSTKFGIVSFTTNPFHPLMWSTASLDVGRWTHRPYCYVWLDALSSQSHHWSREEGRIVNVSVAVATAVNAEGKRELVGMDVGTSEDDAHWKQVWSNNPQERLNKDAEDKAQDRRGGPLPEPACGGQTIPDARFSDLRQSVAGGPDRTTEYLGIGV